MPLLQKQNAVFDHHGANSFQLMTSETFRHGKIYRVQPIFCNLVAMFDMDMRRLRALLAKEENRSPFKREMVGIGLV